MKLPEKTVERMSQYRRVLLNAIREGKTHIFSHELAALHNLTAVQVRRDIMLMGYTGNLRKGYDIKDLIDAIGNILDIDEGQNVAIVGIGDLGKAIVNYFKGKRAKLNLAAAFDIDPNKINRVISGINCYHTNQMAEIIRKENISIGVLAVPPEAAENTAEKLVMSGIKGILNLTTVSLNISQNVYLEEYDMITSLEKVAYFVKKQIYE